MATEPSDREVAEKLDISIEQVELLQRTRGFTNATLIELPMGVLQRSLGRLGYPGAAVRRAALRIQQEVDENGQVPVDAIQRALRQLDSLRYRGAAERIAGVPAGTQVRPRRLLRPTAGTEAAPAGWEWIGPGNIGGRTRSILVHPTNPQIMWVGSVGGGVWRTDDGGTDWDPVDDFMANLAVSSMVMDATDPNHIYAGTGEGFFNLDAIRGAGIFHAVDGTTWRRLASTASPEFQWINRLAISADGAVLLAATNSGVFRSDTPDRLSWTRVLPAMVADIDFHPSDPNLAAAGGLTNGRAYFSRDGGRNWQSAGFQPFDGRVEVTYAVADPSIVYASLGVRDTGASQIWRSSDGGQTYIRRATQTIFGTPARYLGDQGWYDNVIWAGDPRDADFVIVGGIDLWKSTDGGHILVDISTWWDPRSAHADHHAIVSHPNFDGANNTTVFFGNDGGIYKTDDVFTVGTDPSQPRVQGWQNLNHDYGVTQFYGGAANVNSGTVVAGAQDNGTLRYTPTDGPQQWSEMFGGDGGYCAADPGDPNVFYGEYVYLNIHRSTDGGNTGEYISGQYWDGITRNWRWKPPPYQITDAFNAQAMFIAPFVLDPNEPNRILGGGLSLWRTNDAKAPNSDTSGPRWRAIKPGGNAYITAIAVARGNSDLIWVGHQDGAVFRSIDGTANAPAWTRIDGTAGGAIAVGRMCTRIVIDPPDHNVVYVAFAGYAGSSSTRGNVWKTTDGGASWSNIGRLLPDGPVRGIAIHPRRSAFVYVGTEVGLFASEDGGATWSPTNEGPTNCAIYELFWMNETLVCVTHGRGLFRIDLSRI